MDKYTQLEFCIKNANGWIVRNLREYGNSATPKKLIRCEEDRQICEKLLSAILHDKVTIRKSDECGYICER